MGERPRAPFQAYYNPMNQPHASYPNQTQNFRSPSIPSMAPACFPGQTRVPCENIGQAPPRHLGPAMGVPDKSSPVVSGQNVHGPPTGPRQRLPFRQPEECAFKNSNPAMFQHPPPLITQNATGRMNIPPPPNQFNPEMGLLPQHPQHLLPQSQQNQHYGLPTPFKNSEFHENQLENQTAFQQNQRYPMPPPAVNPSIQNKRYPVPPPTVNPSIQNKRYPVPPPTVNPSTQNVQLMPMDKSFMKLEKTAQEIAPAWLKQNEEHDHDDLAIQGNVMSYQRRMKQVNIPDHKNSDKKWIDNWLNEIGKNSSSILNDKHLKSSKEISLSDADTKIRSMMLLMARLQQQTKNLRSIVTDSEAEWEGQVRTALDMKNQLKEMKNSLQDAETISELKRKLSIRRKKRERIKRKRNEDYEEKKALFEHREELHEKLDNWQEQRRLEVEQKRQEEDMKKSADEILNEVRKKISDTTKLLDLHKGLQKLRKLRKDRMKQQGVFTNPYSDENFDVVLQEQFDVLGKRKDTYLAEERALKVMLETEQEDNKEKEREKALLIQRQKAEKQERKEREMLFGKPDCHKEGDSLYPFYQFYDQANLSFESFVQIRNCSRVEVGLLHQDSKVSLLQASCEVTLSIPHIVGRAEVM